MDYLRDRWTRTACFFWSLLALAASVKVVVSPLRHNYLYFRTGTLNWWDGISLYEHVGGVFRYPPTFALVLSPFAVFPLALGNILWNLVSLGLLYYALHELTRRVLPGSWSASQTGLLLLLTLPGVIRGVWSSQSHALTAACLFLALAALSRHAFWHAAWLLALAFFVKLAPLIVGLLLILLYPRRLGWRYAVCLVALALAPFLVRDPGFVVAEYGRYRDYLMSSSQTRWPSFRDAWHVWELTGATVVVPVYRAMQFVCGLAVAAWCLWLSRGGLSERERLTACFAMGACYLLIFGPAVEFNQYVLLAPFLAWAVIQAFARASGRSVALGLYAMTLVFGSGRIERSLGALLGTDWTTAIAPAGTLAFAVWIAIDTRRRSRRSPVASPT